jgi:CRP-like cAMP-binding protein
VARPNFQNLLLQRVSDSDLALLASLTRVEVALHQHLYEAHAPLTAIYFPEDCLASIVAEVGRGTIEVGIVGREGVTNSWIVVGDTQSPFETFVQAAGHAYRVDAAEAKAAIEQSPALRQLFLTFARSYEIQVASTSIANGQALLEERLARWLLMAADRVGEGELPLTHEFLAMMLAVRRPGVTIAIQDLERRGLIDRKRGCVIILDREGLEKMSNGTYVRPDAH